MQSISSALLASLPSGSLRTKLHQTSLGAPILQDTIASSFPDIPASDTMALAAFTLGDLPNDKVRREVVRSMWDSDAEVIVVIDRGTPKGFDLVAQARDQLLRLGRHSARTAAGFRREVDEDDEEELVIGGEKFFAEPRDVNNTVTEDGTSGIADEARGCYIVAPVSHPWHVGDLRCRRNRADV